MSPSPRRRLAALGLALVLSATAPLLAACSSTVSLTPAAGANSVGCADVIVHLPKTIETFAQRDTDAQGTSAWGSPASVLLRCGITTPRVSDLPCYTIQGVDWLVDTTGKSGQDAVYTTYGRTPGVEVVTDSKATPSVLFDLSPAVKGLPVTGKCQSVSDSTPPPVP
ncbi:hypothetical protein AS850_09625 [Frondihabitans sp. 762G35]|uniref:DUF3515 family protein n=1 Tax=Frondihabitans sp. 762G35 TaxID=1446794 RepID=UPI000D21991D|nr:DUF3515 family protein [Frondihabitans sp. 762G35]ARC57334.1 hypothetical protein AS850_09625 [Frondihabitans sp. 762G35]